MGGTASPGEAWRSSAEGRPVGPLSGPVSTGAALPVAETAPPLREAVLPLHEAVLHASPYSDHQDYDPALQQRRGRGRGRDRGVSLLCGLRTTPRTREVVLREHEAWLFRERDRRPVGRGKEAVERGGKDSGPRASAEKGPAPEASNPHALAIDHANCSGAVVDLIRARYPEARVGTLFLRYLVFVLLTDPLREDDTDEVRFGERVQMAVAGRSFYGGYSGSDVVAEVQRHLPSFEVRPADWRRGREQTIVCDGVAPELRQRLREELSKPARQRTYVTKGQARRKDAGTYERRDLLAAAEAVPAPSPTAAFVRDTLNARPPNLFTRSLDFERARRFAATDYAPRRRSGESESDHAARAVRARGSVLASLNAIEAQPQPIYRCSRRGRTDRVSPCHPAIPALPADVRAVLAPSFEEHDLRCSYLSVVSALWEFDRLLDRLLDEAYAPWLDLVRGVAPEHADSHFDVLKAAVKAPSTRPSSGWPVTPCSARSRAPRAGSSDPTPAAGSGSTGS